MSCSSVNISSYKLSWIKIVSCRFFHEKLDPMTICIPIIHMVGCLPGLSRGLSSWTLHHGCRCWGHYDCWFHHPTTEFVFPGCHNLPPNNGMFTREQILKIWKQSRRQPIPRVLRKTLFKYNIWHPSVFPVPDEKGNKEIFSTGTKCAVLNSRSINKQGDSIYELIVDNCLDFLALTETWCIGNSTVSLGQITPPGYSAIHTHRPTRGGGVALIFRDTYKAKRVKTGKYTNFEN